MTTFIWSIDDAGTGDDKMVESMTRICRHFDSHGVKSTWFTVPKPHNEHLSSEWREAFAGVRQNGHDIQLHGLTHEDCYEFGPPAWPATSILSTLQPGFEERRDELMPRYTLANIQARLEEGLEIFRTELDVEPTAFRAPCGAISKPLFAALRNLGIGVHSCMYISGSGYQHLPHNSGRLEVDWVDDIPHRPYVWYEDVIEAPILNEYTWRGSGRRSAEFVRLAQQDIDRVVEESPIAVILMHTHGIADDFGHAFRIVDAVVEHVGRKGGDFSTFHDVIASGALQAAATVRGPDLLEV